MKVKKAEWVGVLPGLGLHALANPAVTLLPLRGGKPSETCRISIKKLCSGLVSAVRPAQVNGCPSADLHRAHSPNPVTPPQINMFNNISFVHIKKR